MIGQTSLTNTTAGYMVAANGQSLAALNQQLNTSIPGGPVTGAQGAIRPFRSRSRAAILA